MTRIFQQPFLKVNGFWAILQVAFVGSILLTGCTAPTHLANTPEPPQDEEMHQRIALWKDVHISKVIQKWGEPKAVSNHGVAQKTYTWEMPVHDFLTGREIQMKGFQLQPGQPIHRPRRQGGIWDVKLTFYTRPNGTIYKTDVTQHPPPR